MPEPNKLEEFAWVRHALIVALARGEKSQRQLAGEFSVTDAAITSFKSRHAEEIAAVRANAMSEYTGLQLADKAARLAAYEDLIRKLTKGAPKVAGKDAKYVKDEDGNQVYEIDSGGLTRALRNIAEELGALPTRIQLTGEMDVKTEYTINGVNPDNLK